MKNNNFLKLFGILFISFSMLTSCSSDDDNGTPEENGTPNNSANSALFDKWWYDSEDFAGDVYFHSDGQYEQVVSLLGNDIPGEGNWTWEDEEAGIMKIENLGGDSQVVSTIWFKFSDIEESTMTIQQSTNGTSYSSELFYQDTDN